MQQHLIRSPKGAKKNRKRVGRGDGSGYGTYAGRGLKGQKSRAGSSAMVKFQGGQLSLLKRLPSIRGFTNVFRKEWGLVNVDQLNLFPAGTEVTQELLVRVGFLNYMEGPYKVLGRGEIDVPLNVSAHKFSASARSKIEAAGGSVTVIE